MSLLSEILRQKRHEVSSRKSTDRRNELKRQIADLDKVRGFEQALKRGDALVPRLIAEVKKASPSRGLIRVDFDPVRIARSYQSAGVQALSILTDRTFFQGDPAFLRLVREAVDLPILQKDFTIDEYQIYEARALGADAILLIVAALEDSQLGEYLHLASELDLAALVEVHHERELERVIGMANLIGINNRDLVTFDVDLNTTMRVMRAMPPGNVVVSESGISSSEDVRRLADLGIDALLIGETFMRALDIEAKVKELMTPSPAHNRSTR